jgi:hypothetical protein
MRSQLEGHVSPTYLGDLRFLNLEMFSLVVYVFSGLGLIGRNMRDIGCGLNSLATKTAWNYSTP